MLKVKICGLMRPGDAEMASKLGADMVGAILVPKSPRSVSIARAKEILAAAGKGVAKVAVVIPKDLKEIKKMAGEIMPDYLQLHLTFPARDLKILKGRLNTKMIVVVPIPQKVENKWDIINMAKEAEGAADIVLLDTKGAHGGGTGKTHDWGLSREICSSLKKPVMLAGGLAPMNVREAVRTVRPYGVDVATGVEEGLGIKSPELMKEFIQEARGAEVG
ncbi:MAG: phosphoribosylanthranilate isomerase [Candidatus Hadarchaeota archaeon]